MEYVADVYKRQLQHVVAMIVGCVTPAIIVSGVAGLNELDQVILVQAALFTSAISTLLQLFPFIRFKNFQLGSALPVIMGISFASVSYTHLQTHLLLPHWNMPYILSRSC